MPHLLLLLLSLLLFLLVCVQGQYNWQCWGLRQPRPVPAASLFPSSGITRAIGKHGLRLEGIPGLSFHIANTLLPFVFSVSLAKGQEGFVLAPVCCGAQLEESLAHKAQCSTKCCAAGMFSRPLHPMGGNDPYKVWKSFLQPQNSSRSRETSAWCWSLLRARVSLTWRICYGFGVQVPQPLHGPKLVPSFFICSSGKQGNRTPRSMGTIGLYARAWHWEKGAAGRVCCKARLGTGEKIFPQHSHGTE